MKKHISLAKAIKLASVTMIMGATMLPLSVAQAEEEQLNSQMAVEEGEEEVEEVFVTGSRIATTVTDTPRPITILTSESLEAAGMENIADVLRNTSYNTMGSYREQSGSSFGGAALINLKGLGEEYTAVLINGRRVPGNPFTGSSAVDLSTIPMSAVERVEILTDSASAVYGADAIGGVINIIMKKDMDGGIFEISTARPERDDANLDNVKATIGTSNEKGSVLFSIDWQKKGYIADSDRDYSGLNFLSDAPIPTDGVDVTGANGGGNTGFDASDNAFIVGACDEDYYLEMLNPYGSPGIGCGYKYSDISVMTMGVERFSTFMDARRKLNGDHEIYLENRTTRAETFGRFAPAIGVFGIDAAAPINDTGEDYVLAHRFVAHGPRDDYARISEFDTVGGITGSLFDDTVNYDLNARRYNYSAASFSNNYVLKSVIADLVTDGEYDPTNPNAASNAGAIAQSKASLSRDLGSEVTAFQLTLDGMTEVAGFGMGWAFGLEQSSEAYQDKYDSYREAQNVLGSAGNTAQGSRERWAAFAEAQVNVMADLDVNLAVRYDDYNDFGGNVSPQISTRYAVNDIMTVRASAGTGFKAPNLTDMYQLYSLDNQEAKDTTRCSAQVAAGDLASINECPSSQIEAYTSGNADLKSEKSTSFNVGIVIEPLEDLLVSVDYYSITIDDVATELKLEDLFALEQAGTLPDGIVINRGETVDGIPGVVTKCATDVVPNCGLVNAIANLDKREVAGADLRLEYTIDTSFGSFKPELHWSHVIEYKESTVNGEIDRLGKQNGDDLYPTDRANLSLAYENGAVSVNYLYNWISEVDAATGDGVFEAWSMHTINASYETAEDVTLSFGVRNLTDEDPSIETESGWNSGTSQASLSMYDVGGRTFLASVKVEF